MKFLIIVPGSRLCHGNRIFTVLYKKLRNVYPLLALTVLFSFSSSTEATLREPNSIWFEPSPIYSDLLSPAMDAFLYDRAFIWGHLLAADKMRRWAKQMGVRYSLNQIRRMHANNGLVPIIEPIYSKESLDVKLRTHAQFGLTYALYAFYYDKKARKQFPFILDYRFDEQSITNLKTFLPKLRPQTRFIYTGDEHIVKALRKGRGELLKRNNVYTGFGNVDRLVKERFGFGTFGIPNADDAYNPFEAAAFTRWTLEKFRERQKKLKEVVTSLAPEIPIISTDPMTGIFPYEFSLMSPYVDIFTHQTIIGEHLSRTLEAACIVKLLKDLTKKEVWPCIHINRNAATNTPSPAEVREYLSVLLLNGATGFHLYTRDGYGDRTSKTTLNYYFGSPSRWQALMEILQLVREKGFPKLPRPDLAILFSNDTSQHQAAPGRRPNPAKILSLYALVGPICRSWFNFVDEHRILEGVLDPEKYRALIIPDLTYTRKEIMQPLIQYVREGGTLICMDPRAFSFGLDGKDLSAMRERLFGVLTGEKAFQDTMFIQDWSVFPGLQERSSFESRGSVVSIQVELREDAEPVASFEDGSPAIVIRREGKGKAIFFCWNPLDNRNLFLNKRDPIEEIYDPIWKAFYRSFLKGLGINLDQDIWRFRLPSLDAENVSGPSDRCVTNNFIRWDKETPHHLFNIDTNGGYRLSRSSKGHSASSFIPFSKGKLTNRPRAVWAPRTGPVAEWVEVWDQEGPLDITFDLRRSWPLSRLKLFYSGFLPKSTVSVSSDQKDWNQSSGFDASDAGEDVLSVVLDFPETTGRYVRLSLNSVNAERPLRLVEIEIWAHMNDKKDNNKAVVQ